eukprot:462854_1
MTSFLCSVLVLWVNLVASTALTWDLRVNPRIPIGKEEMMVGYHNGSAWLFGGSVDSTGHVMQYRIDSNDFVVHNGITSGSDLRALSQSYTQIGSTIFMYPVTTSYIVSFDMSTISYNRQRITKVDANQRWTCLANTDNYLFVLGGGSATAYKSFLIYDFSINSWITNGPSMLHSNEDFACTVHAISQYLYTFGGIRNNIELDSVAAIDVSDMNNINTKNWAYLTDTLTVARRYLVCVVYNQFIYIIGGWNLDLGGYYYTRVDVLDTETNTITLDSNMVNKAASVAAIVAADYYTLYVFGGWDGSSRLNIIQYTNFPTLKPTNIPTLPPTHAVVYPYDIEYAFVVQFNEYYWPSNLTNQSNYDPYLYCNTYFRSSNQTYFTLQDVDGVIESVLQLFLSNNDEFIINIPQTKLNTNANENIYENICQILDNQITLRTIFTVGSVSVYTETQKHYIYGTNSLLYNQTVNALEQYFKTPVVLYVSNAVNDDDKDDLVDIIIKIKDNFIVYIAAIIITFIVILLAMIHKKIASNAERRKNNNVLLYKFHAIDDIKFIKIIAFTLQCLDLWSDFDFVYKLFVLQSMNLFNLIVILTSLFFAIVPCVTNIFLVFYVQKKRRFNPFVHEWLDSNHTMKIFMLFMCLCGSIFHSFGLSNSYMFGYNLFLAPLNISDFQILTQLRFKYLIVLESVPQLIVQCLWWWMQRSNINTINESLFFTVYISIALSLINILASVLEYMFKCLFRRNIYKIFEIKLKVKQKENDDSKAILSTLFFHLSLQRAIPILGIKSSNVYHTQYNESKNELIVYGIYCVDDDDNKDFRKASISSKNKTNFKKTVETIFGLKNKQLSFTGFEMSGVDENETKQKNKNIEIQLTTHNKQNEERKLISKKQSKSKDKKDKSVSKKNDKNPNNQKKQKHKQKKKKIKQ